MLERTKQPNKYSVAAGICKSGGLTGLKCLQNSHGGYAFHVSDTEFDAIFHRIQEADLVYGSAPWGTDDAKLNDWGGGRGVYFKVPDGHLLELMTVPQ